MYALISHATALYGTAMSAARQPAASPGSALIDLAAVDAWMDTLDLPAGRIEAAAPIVGGTQNRLVRFRRAGEEYVLRAPPERKRPNSDETMRREARVLAALGPTGVPHPTFVALCTDESVIGSVFYLMRPVEGFNPGVEMPEAAADPGFQSRMGLAMVDGLLELRAVDLDDTGLRDLGRADGWLERQVDRWAKQLGSYDELDGYGGAALPQLGPVRDWLRAHQPLSCSPGLIHGDYQFTNVLFEPQRPELAAIVDWELATVGDPYLDFGHLLATWPGGEHDCGAVLVDAPYIPTRDELVERYCDGTGATPEVLLWYRVLACYRLGIILEGSNARAAAGLAPREIGDRLHAIAVRLFEQANDLIG